MAQENIRELVRGCQQNDRRCQEQLYTTYFPILRNLVQKYTRNEDAIISIINNGFLKIFKNISYYNADRPFAPWAKTIIFHALSDYFKAQKVGEKKIVPLFEGDRPTGENALHKLYFDDLIKGLKALPPMSERVFYLYAIEGYKHKEISEALGISEGTSKWHVSNARSIFKKYLKERKKENRYGS